MQPGEVTGRHHLAPSSSSPYLRAKLREEKAMCRFVHGFFIHEHVYRGVDHLFLKCTYPPPYSTRPFRSSLASGSVGTPKLSKIGREPSQDGNKTVKAWLGPKADNIVLGRVESGRAVTMWYHTP
ncbi:hypothetical protein DVH24_035962 [Malus domestica]|uniref:Uncharacterized protein n=1 Tax=Malus domestica TaxID=3750 RepID=A0A498JTZ8_MALDO|nr:hypothetical protein DVH24_035962 [Malus domestica]